MSLVIRLTEPSVFVSPPRRHEHRIPTDVTAPSIIRGLLVLKLSHTAKITSIDVSLDGISTTDWPEGIGPRRLDVVEAQAFLSIKTSLLDSIATNRRALSLGPGVSDIPDNLEEGFSLTADGTSARRGEEPMSVQSLPQGRLRSASTMPPLRQIHQVHRENYSSLHSPYSPAASPVAQSAYELVVPGTTRQAPRPSLYRLGSGEPTSQLPGGNTLSSSIPIASSSSNPPPRHHRPGRRDSLNPDDEGTNLREENHETPVSSIPKDYATTDATMAPPSSSSLNLGTSLPNSANQIERQHSTSPWGRGLLSEHDHMSAESRVYPRSQRASDFRASRSGRQDSPATDGSPSREDNHRSRPRFRWKAMSNFFREIGNEVRRAGEESSARSVSQSHHVQGGSHSPRDDVSESWGTGSGGTDSRSRDRGSTSRGSQPGRADSDELQTRGRDMTINPIREAAELNIQSQLDRMRQDGYREFKKGTYTYPISFAIPPDSLPSITCPFGNVKYTISATVHRVGTFLPKLTATKEVNVVSCLSPESNEDTGYLLEERQWEEQLCYMIRLEQTHVTIGGVLPVKLTLFPLDKVSIYRIDVVLGEKIDYYGRTHGIVRHDPVRKYELLSVWQSDTLGPLLPILSNSPSAGRDSPLTPYVCPDNVSPGMMPFASTTSFDRTDEAVTHLLSPTGPWKLRFKLRLPDCSSGFHFTSKSPGALIIVSHMIRLSIRLSAANKLDLQGKPKLFDITVDTPINILSCQCKTEYTHLPTYEQTAFLASDRTSNQEGDRPLPTSSLRPRGGCSSRQLSSEAASPPGTLHHPCPGSSVGTNPAQRIVNIFNRERGHETTSNREDEAGSAQFARLVAGQENPAGDVPPPYSE